MKNYCCPICDEQLRITEGNYIFTYNINCFNNHKKMNVTQDDLLSYEKTFNYNCKRHKKFNDIYCYSCNEDICFSCYNELHKNHKIEYLKAINFSNTEKFHLNESLEREKELINSFLKEFLDFQNVLNLYINMVYTGINKLLNLKEKLITNILQKNISYSDIENVKSIINSKYYQNINENIKSFTNSKTFLQKYENMKNIFMLLNKREQYQENKNIIDNYYNYNSLIPINDKYFITSNKNSIKIEKKIENNSTDIIYSKYLNKNDDVDKIIKTAKKDNSFYILNSIFEFNDLDDFGCYTEIIEMEILNLDKDIKVNFNKLKNFDSYVDLLVLSLNKNIIINSNNLYLYDDSFDKNKVIFTHTDGIFQSLKINDNTFIFSVYNNDHDIIKNIWIMKIEDDLIEKNIIENCGPYFIYYNNDKKILFSLYNNKIYLTNFNTILPEVIQVLEMNYYDIRYNSSIKYLNNFNDDSIFFIGKNNDSKFYEVEYIVQYKIIKDELKEISRIELSSKKIENSNNSIIIFPES